jgi:uridine kinase
MKRDALLAELSRRIATTLRPHPVRVAIDGVDGAGKTTLADELVAPVRALGRPVVRGSVDHFHRPRAQRYRRGRDSPEGYFRDSFDYPVLASRLLAPLGPGGSRRIRTRAFDYRVDQPVDAPEEQAPSDAVLLFDGIFLQCPVLREHWDLVIFLDVPFDVTLARMVERDGVSAELEDPQVHRWVGGQRIYLEECSPAARADVVVDNRDVAWPRILG